MRNPPTRRSTPTVLLVDDDAFNREGMRLYLEQEGFADLEAGSAVTAEQAPIVLGMTAHGGHAIVRFRPPSLPRR